MNQNTSASDELDRLIKTVEGNCYLSSYTQMAVNRRAVHDWYNKQVAEILTRLLEQQVPVVATDLSILGNFFAVPTEAIQAELERLKG